MKKLLSLLLCLGTSVVLMAQTQKVTGSVQDAQTGEPLIGVSVIEVGTTNGVVTDIDGNFKLEAQSGAKLKLSYVAMPR